MTAVTEQAIDEALAALPSSADEIADLFADLGIAGQISDACRCPVANYLHEEFPTAVQVIAYRAAFVSPSDAPADPVFADVPPHVFEFIKSFDAGAYPELVLDDEWAA